MLATGEGTAPWVGTGGGSRRRGHRPRSPGSGGRGPGFAVLGDIGIAQVRLPAVRTGPGLNFAAKTVLKASIVVLGSGLSFHEVLTIGGASRRCCSAHWLWRSSGLWCSARALGVSRDLRKLIGVGSGICGASGIAATDAVISASDVDVSHAIATIFTFNECEVHRSLTRSTERMA